MSEIILLGCPFNCDSELQIEKFKDQYMVRCVSCGCNQGYRISVEAAVNMWNDRGSEKEKIMIEAVQAVNKWLGI